MRASGKFGLCRLKVVAKYTLKGDAVGRDEGLERCALKFQTGFSKANVKYGAACAAVESESAFETYIGTVGDCLGAASAGATFASCAGAAVCGDGVASGGEACDLSDLRGAGCQSLGLGGGTLACSASCTYDTSACSPCDDLIYLIDDASRLLSFDPRKIGTPQGPFTVIGPLTCPASAIPVPGLPLPVTPYSLAVDRSGTARVLYTSGELFAVDVGDASCTPTGFAPQQGGQWLVFQQAFATDTSGGTTETQYVGGGSPDGAPGGLFGSINSLVIQNRGSLPNAGELSPSLTGLGDGTVFGFYPGTETAFVQQIDKVNGNAVGPAFGIPGGLGGGVTAWAFAHWGGTFYVFVTTTDGLGGITTTARAIDRTTGAYQGAVVSDVPYIFHGAGVATCAPLGD